MIFLNNTGNLILAESYVEGEELTGGKNYEEKVYDDNGNVIKTIRWNSLDSSSKFYSESEIAENGQTLADKDETGEISAEYEYVSGTNVVNSVKYSNGSKFAYGRNSKNFQITSITQNSADGEANQTDILYANASAQDDRKPMVVKNNKIPMLSHCPPGSTALRSAQDDRNL